jgi:uncharacterized membrane protein YbaN (DUF454 family)
MLPQRAERLLWRLLALLFVALGVIGIVLPVVPTVPFLLVAVWAAGRGWPALEQWLLGHPRYGHAIRQWRSAGIVSRRAKWASTLMMGCSALLLQLTAAPTVLKVGVPLFMALVAIWLWHRPEG